MKIYNVGEEELSELSEDNTQFEWVVFWYESGSYEGYGEAVALCKEDNLLYVSNLGHCSCYGPLEGGLQDGDKMTIEEFLKDKDDIHAYDAKDGVKAKVKELLPAYAPVFVEKFDFLKSL